MGFVCMKSPFQQLDSLETNSTYRVMRYKLIWLPKPYLDRLFLAVGWRHLSLPQLRSHLLGRIQSTTGFTSSHPKELLVHVSYHPYPNEEPETISRQGLPRAWSRMAHPGWTHASGCCICLGEKKCLKGTRQVAHFPSHTKKRSSGSPCSLQLICSLLFITRGPRVWTEQTLESSQPWRDDSGWILCFYFIFLKKIKAQKRIGFDLLLFVLAATKRDKTTTCCQTLTTFNC